MALSRCVRTLVGNGNSKTISIPGVIRANNGWLVGQPFEVSYDEMTYVVTLRAITPTEALLAKQGDARHRRCVRALSRNGNNRTIALPAPILSRRHWQVGQPFELTYDDETKVITLRAVGEPQERGFRGGYATHLREVPA